MSWLVACTQPQAEFKVVSRMRDNDFEVFFPRIRRKVMHRGRRIYRTDPMFPGYAMVRQCEKFRELFEIRRGQFSVMMQPDADLPALVPDDQVEEIRSMCTSDDVYNESDRFKRGQKVRAKSGSLTDLVGTFTESRSNQEIALFMMLGRSVPVSFRRGELETV